jgi:hypothetical protein
MSRIRLASGDCRLVRSDAACAYECKHPGELIHIDIKKLGKIDGVATRSATARTHRIFNPVIGVDLTAGQ